MSAALLQASASPTVSPNAKPKFPGLAALDRYRLDPERMDSHLFSDLGSEGGAMKRKIALAFFLLAVGGILLGFGLDQFFEGAPGGIPMIVIGSLAFLPGAYYTRLAYYAWKGRAGFEMSDIPEV